MSSTMIISQPNMICTIKLPVCYLLSLSAWCNMPYVLAAPDLCRSGENIFFLAFLKTNKFRRPKIGLSHKNTIFSKLWKTLFQGFFFRQSLISLFVYVCLKWKKTYSFIRLQIRNKLRKNKKYVLLLGDGFHLCMFKLYQFPLQGNPIIPWFQIFYVCLFVCKKEVEDRDTQTKTQQY